MSKKNRNKFRARPTVRPSDTNSSAVANSSGSKTLADASISPSSSSGNSRISASASAMNAHVAEYKIISKDLVRLVIFNVIIFGAVLALYFTNKNNGYLERIFHSLF